MQKYDPAKPIHRTLAQTSEECHRAAAKGGGAEVLLLERKVDSAVAKLWGITDDELKAIQEALVETRSSKRAKNESEDSADDTDG